MQATPFSRKKIGIIAGSGPEAGIDLWTKLLAANRKIHGERFRGDLDAPDVTIHSESTLGLSMELAENDEAVWQCLRKTAESMAERVDYYAIACNTLNYYQPQLEALGLPATFVSFSDAVIRFVKDKRIERVALLGAKPVTDLGPWSHYRMLAEHVAIELPKPQQAEALHRLIYDVKTHGGNAEGIGRRFRAILDALESRTVLLACTELPLITIEAGGKQVVDVTELVAQRLAQLANGMQP